MFTDNDIDQMKAYDIRELLPAGHEMKGKNNLKSGCPLCGLGKDCFGININKMLWICHKCDSSGTAIDYVMARDKLPITNALHALADIMGIHPLKDDKARLAASIREHRKDATPSRKPELVTEVVDCTPLLPTIEAANMRLMHPTTPQDKACLSALYARGITDHEIERFKLGYLPKWANVGAFNVSPKVLIPRFVDGKLCGVNSKTYRDEPKYMFAGSRGAFNFDAVHTADTVIIVEGEFDAMLLSRFTTAAVITLGGATMKLSQNEKLALSLVREIYALFDGDTAGQNGLNNLIKQLGKKRVKTLSVPDGMDITDVWKESGDDGVIDLLPAYLRPPIQTSDGLTITAVHTYTDGLIAGLLDGDETARPYRLIDGIAYEADTTTGLVTINL